MVTDMVKPHLWTDGGEQVLILRRCNPDGSSSHGFKWDLTPGERNTFEDWDPEPKCGGGGHGWPWGMGLGDGMDFDVINDTFLVIAANPTDVIGELLDGGQQRRLLDGGQQRLTGRKARRQKVSMVHGIR